ncbi:hypothetical protein [Azospirillum rugosum]|uniref:Nucleic acid-binding protein n=1 Tax=Azospirillum rugosum TaxID=416170 RepID=A0ABS4SJB6_9PROT|nr:hypothetical protein [Azospirillum rugosum]MBP2292668.1 putative nucleic acid-binding protein [Azospirillum rugosum]MDQ0526308.1 putative nucleic acid-binding protein [Azospirillum rugosum]
MNRIFDSSSLINLANGSLLEMILSIPGLQAQIGPQVKEECASIAPLLETMIGAGSIVMLDDEDLPASLFFRLRETYGLGAGETECLAFAKIGDQAVCCDDRAARTMIAKEIGSKRVIGTLGLLIQGVHLDLIEAIDAFGKYQQMRLSGGFLPDWSYEQFKQAIARLSS